MLTVRLGEVPEMKPPELVRRWPVFRLRLLDLLLGRAGLKRGCMGRSVGIGAVPLNWLSGTGTDIDRPILSASPWYRALPRKRLVSEGMVGTEGGRSSSCPFP